MDTTNYKQTSFGIYVPSHIIEQLNHLDMSTVACYESHLRNTGKAPSTIEKYSRFIRLFVLFLGDHYLSVTYVRAWLDSLKKTRHINTVNNAISALNGLFKWLGRADCTISFFPYQEPQYREDDRDLDEGDFACLLSAADARMKAILLTFHGTGIRVSELRFFTVEGVQSGKVVVDNKGKVRTVFLDPGTKTVILNYCGKRGIKSGVIFPQQTGGCIEPFIYLARHEKAGREGGRGVEQGLPAQHPSPLRHRAL